MNKKVLPAIYSTAFWCLFVDLLFFGFIAVTPSFYERSNSGYAIKPKNGKTTNRHQNAVE